MRRPNQTPIAENDLNEFVASESDFAFEMNVLSVLSKLNFACSHGGTYEDPITHRIRQYDIAPRKLILIANSCLPSNVKAFVRISLC